MKTMLVALVVSLALLTRAAELRTWTFEKHGNAIMAELMDFTTVTNGLAAILRMYDGSTYTVPVAFLVGTNRTYLQAEYNFRVALQKAEAAKREKEREKEQAEELAKNDPTNIFTISGRIIHKVQEGLVVDSGAYEREHLGTEVSRRIFIGVCLLTDHPRQEQFVDDDGVYVRAFINGQFTYTTALGAEKTVRKFKFIKVLKPSIPVWEQ